MSTKYSILIPVYNVEKYIRKCLDSVVNQTYKDFEVIIMIDGSTDSSANICEEYAAKDERLKVFYQENRGLLLTRRNSLNKAKGEYILFLDSDDYYELHLLKTINEYISKYSCDLLLFRFKRVTNAGKVYATDINIFPDESIFTNDNKNLIWETVIASNKLNNIWAKVVKRDLIDFETDYSPFKDKKGEDLLQSLPLLYNANKILYLDKTLYNYRLSSTGRGRNFKLKYLDDMEDVRKVTLKYLYKAKNVSKKDLELFYSFYTLSIIHLIRAMIVNYKMDQIIVDKLNQVKKQDLFVDSKKFLVLSTFNTSDKILYYLLINGKYKLLNITIKTNSRIRWLIKKIIKID